ncbi:probable ADP-ribosylation factor GTPase-activating protein AGD14 [Juglans microcarpa x Juglans regia]|uniref:probable ADP-ribosylation factor GTPase-activating protein AGD14 n=1 Tax=Juglans microcarpa x Juglans regia TaxID=2249226 RepID=UPI001B7DFCAF|nr:probable ADP-ribosylation factor GTPase-activating protein AGD14 [Juglans microcarpa x Juglans regia]XP_041027238.1 probable ADP-ribosylation factor GTPase-activating protein AGD14 [Juglans microcarpa x Juglans regia]
MGSKREEERNERIIRGLMKLPPNRRCINCNSLGPQYVCTNFWSFVCTTCSGIHREFTHRVKSVSMAKFTSQEVEALQNGGNQRARETYLKDWDLQMQRLPDNSNVDKIREFIKNVYEDRSYAGGKTSDKPPRDMQSTRLNEGDTRRASSYHSYSQSPPYDYQYEDRRYGKQAAALTRKPGSDRGRYEGKMSNFIYSPGRLSDKVSEDRFANEGSISRVSDYSVSSAGDPFRSTSESPNFQKDVGFSSPPVQPLRSLSEVWFQEKNTSFEANAKRDADGIPHAQRTASLGSFGSMDSNSLSRNSYNLGGLTDVVSEPEQSAVTFENKVSTFPQSSIYSQHSGSLDLFQTPLVSEPEPSAASSFDSLQAPAASSARSLDLFQSSLVSPASSVNAYQPPQTFPLSSLDLFAGISQQQSVTTFDKEKPQLSVPENGGWATFDTPKPTPSITHAGNPTEHLPSSDVGSLEKFDPFSSLFTNMEWPSFQFESVYGPSTMSNQWHDNLHNVQASTIANTQGWKAFEDTNGHLPSEGNKQGSELQLETQSLSSSADQYFGLRELEDSNKEEIQRAASHGGSTDPSVPSHVAMGPFYTPTLPLVGETQSHAMDRKSTNPFDLPNDSDMEQSNMFLDMNSLQAALPGSQLPSTFNGGVSEPWFPQNPVSSYISNAGQGGLTYMAGQAPNPQIANVPSQGPVASIGGNPFA